MKNISDSMVFHAGTISIEQSLVTNGGRVVAISSYGDTLKEALQRSYQSITHIKFNQMNYRKDIGWEFE